MSRVNKSREIVERIVVEGDLVLLTPTSLGNGDNDGLTDMSLLLDEYEGKALLTGTSIAGALRNYLRECLLNFGVSEESKYKNDKGRLKDASGIDVPLPAITHLFGSVEDYGAQSLLIIDDALSSNLPTRELRDGVKIDGATRTAEDKAKFDIELLEAETTFKLRFELLLSDAKTKDKDGNEISMFPPRDELLIAFATALQGFEKSEIYLGARKRRGYGECKVKNWQVKKYNLKDKAGLLDWLKNGGNPLNGIEPQTILTALDIQLKDEYDKRAYFELDAWFALDGSMLIRSGSKLGVSDKGQPDDVHLRSKRGNGTKPIVSGTSLAGVLRHRAVRIVNTLKPNDDGKFVEEIFGVDMEKLKKRNDDHKKNGKPLEETFASRLEVRETVIKDTNDLVQTRVKIDRFTGGAFEGALFDAAPVFSDGEKQAVNLKLKLRTGRLKKDDGTLETEDEARQRTDAEIGLLLLLLKDLWTSDLPIGGESSIGRGRLKGISANLRKQKDGKDEWNINLDQMLTLSADDRKKLNDFVDDFNGALKNGKAKAGKVA